MFYLCLVLKNLTEIALNQSTKIHSFDNKEIASKLMAMGVMPGKTIEVLRKDSFSKTYIVLVQDLFLAIRATEAKQILV